MNNFSSLLGHHTKVPLQLYPIQANKSDTIDIARNKDENKGLIIGAMKKDILWFTITC